MKNSSTPDTDVVEGLTAVRKALDEMLRQIRLVSAAILPADLEQLSVEGTISQAVRAHAYRTGAPTRYAASTLPEQLPVPFKASLYRFVLESLERIAPSDKSSLQTIKASFDGERIVLELICQIANTDGTGEALSARAPLVPSLRNRVEAVGGSLQFGTLASNSFSLTAEFNFSEVNDG